MAIFAHKNYITRCMEAIINMRNFLKFINSMALSPSNKRWLGEQLIHEAREEEILKKNDEKSCLFNSLVGSWADVDIETMKRNILEGRQSDDIQKLTRFDGE